MNTITHALLPVIAAGVCGRAYLGAEARGNAFSRRGFLLIGVAGAAPDLLDPHLSLADRYSSWTHSVVAWAGFTLILVVLHAWRAGIIDRRLGLWLSGGYLLHLFCDAIAGGIAWLYPFAPDAIVGHYLISPRLWLPLDLACLLFTYFLFRAIPRFRKVKSSGES